MPAEPSVTVLMAVKDGEAYVAEAIESVIVQTIRDWELIVVDDASQDATPKILERYADGDDRIRVITTGAAVGPYAAANIGLEAARGRYIARLDADDVALPDRLARQRSFLEQNSGAAAVVGAWQLIGPDGALRDVRRVPTTSPRALPWALCVVSGIVHSTAFIERSALQDLGGYVDGPVAGDLALWCVLSRSGRLAVMDDVLTLYRRHDSQLTAKSAEAQEQAAVTILIEHLRELAGEAWMPDEAAALFATGRWLVVPLRDGLRALRRFERAWRADLDLSPDDRRELRQLTRRLRLRLLRERTHFVLSRVSRR